MTDPVPEHTAPLSRDAVVLRRAIHLLCLSVTAAGGGPARLDLSTSPFGDVPPVSSDELRAAVLDVWEGLCRDDRRWAFPDRLAVRRPGGAVEEFTAPQLPPFPTEEEPAAGLGLGAALAAHREGVSVVAVPDGQFPGRRAPSALLRRGPDDVGSCAVLVALPGGSLAERTDALRDVVLDAAERLHDVGGGEVVADARTPGGSDDEPLTSADAWAGYRQAVRRARDAGTGMPSRVTVVLDTSSVHWEPPVELRTDPPVQVVLDRPDHRTGHDAVLRRVAQVLRGRSTDHRGGGGTTVTANGGPGRDYQVHLVWTAPDPWGVDPVPDGVRLPTVLEVRSGDERHRVRDALALAEFLHARTGWRTGVVVAGQVVRTVEA